jgi:hypothetical protein
MDLTAATHTALRKGDGMTVISEAAPGKVEVRRRLTAFFPPLRLFGAIFPSVRHFK